LCAIVTGLCERIIPPLCLILIDLAVTIVVFSIADLRHTKTAATEARFAFCRAFGGLKILGDGERLFGKSIPTLESERSFRIFRKEANEEQTTLRAFFGKAFIIRRLHQATSAEMLIGEGVFATNKIKRKANIFRSIRCFW
jgi:hypothetical protein